MTFAEIGLDGSGKVRDLWAKKDLGSFRDEFAMDVPFHGARLVKFEAERE